MQDLICFIAEKFFIIILAVEGLYLLLVHRSQWRELMITALVIGGLSFFISLVANRIILDPRPFIVQGFTPLIHSSTDNGFPSDHTLLLAATAAILMTVSKRAGLLGFLGAFIVGFARVYVGVHHVLDIIGSVVIVELVALSYRMLLLKLKRAGSARS